jgi:glycosyltransferase involved in cell wall biosynthesis
VDAASAPLAVLTPVYNRPEEIERSAASVLAGLRPGDAYVVVDDGSEVPVVIDDPRATVVRHEVNHGLLAARNSLLGALPEQAAWAVFLDSDDILIDGWRDLVAAALPLAPLLFFDALLAGTISGDFVVAVRGDLLAGESWDEQAWGFEGVMWARIARDHPGRHVAVPLAHGPRAGARADSASAITADPVRARAMARGAEGYRAAFADDLRTRFPDRDADLALTALTWRLIAGDATLGDALRLRSAAERAGQRARWARLAGFAALPAGIRRRVLARRARPA